MSAYKVSVIGEKYNSDIPTPETSNNDKGVYLQLIKELLTPFDLITKLLILKALFDIDI